MVIAVAVTERLGMFVALLLRMLRALPVSAVLLCAGQAFAGAQAEEKLSASVQTSMASAIADRAAPRLIGDVHETQAW